MTSLATPLLTRAITDKETTRLLLAMSTFRDGTGQEREKDGTTRPGWRDLERIFAEVLRGTAPENKDIFDVVVPVSEGSGDVYGISLKSKHLSRKSAIDDLESDGRVHMELANSPAKFWERLSRKGVSEADFTHMRKADLIGRTLTQVIEDWHNEAKEKYELTNKGKTLHLENSVFITVSYGRPVPGVGRSYQVHSFSLSLPEGLNWAYISPRCLRATDPRYNNQTVLDWYGLSGGQLKYYPRAADSLYKTRPFVLLQPNNVSILEKAEAYWSDLWEQAS